MIETSMFVIANHIFTYILRIHIHTYHHDISVKIHSLKCLESSSTLSLAVKCVVSIMQYIKFSMRVY